MIEIKGCPMCGCKGRLKVKNRTVIQGETVRNCYVFCKHCDTRGKRILYKDFNNYEEAENKAIECWNRRV